MDNNYSQIQELLHQKADLQVRLKLLPYEGSPEIKEVDGKKYLYMRRRVGSRLSSTYVDVYTDELYQQEIIHKALKSPVIVRFSAHYGLFSCLVSG